MIKLGQIGIGHNHGEAKMLAARKFPELFDVIGYAEEDESWVKERGGLAGYAGLPRLSVEEIIEQSDAVLIESDVWNLTKYARLCADAGKHMHLDKPACGTVPEFESVINTVKEKNLVLQMGYMYRYNPAIRRCIELYESGELGEIYTINAEMSTFHGKSYKEWLTNFSGGILYILGSHLVDLIVYILGEPEKIHTFCKHTCLDGVDFPDNNLAVLEYKKALAKVTVSSVEVNGWGRRQFVVCGSRGSVEIEPIEVPTHMTFSSTKMTDKPYSDIKETVPVRDLAKSERYDEMMRDFYAYIMGEKKNPYSCDHNLAVHRVLCSMCGVNEIGKGKH